MNLKEFLREYGEEVVSFSSYYKYTFVFSNEKVTVFCGGHPDNIYKFSVLPRMKVNSLQAIESWTINEPSTIEDGRL